jgi:hypothetical protein
VKGTFDVQAQGAAGTDHITGRFDGQLQPSARPRERHTITSFGSPRMQWSLAMLAP